MSSGLMIAPLQALHADLEEGFQESTVIVNWPPADGVGEQRQQGDVERIESRAQAIAERPRLHPEAEANFDTKAAALLRVLSVVPPEPVPEVGAAADPHSSDPLPSKLPEHAKRGTTLFLRNGEGAAPVAHGSSSKGLRDGPPCGRIPSASCCCVSSLTPSVAECSVVLHAVGQQDRHAPTLAS